MRHLVAITLFVVAGTLFAESPFVGTWKLNSAKSKYMMGKPAKDAMLIVAEKADNLQVEATGSNTDGSPLSIKYTVPVKGGAGQVQEGPYDAVSAKVIGTSVRDNTYTKAGKPYATRHWELSADGKTLQSRIKGLNNVGQKVAGTDFFEKQ